jgi:hypothetical protein
MAHSALDTWALLWWSALIYIVLFLQLLDQASRCGAVYRHRLINASQLPSSRLRGLLALRTRLPHLRISIPSQGT